jgi:hypothetical protein
MNACFLLRIVLAPALLAATLCFSHAADPVVSNLTAVQRTGTRLLDIRHDVTADTPTVTVSLEVSVDGGMTLSVPNPNVS